jgi:hypothetical protein
MCLKGECVFVPTNYENIYKQSLNNNFWNWVNIHKSEFKQSSYSSLSSEDRQRSERLNVPFIVPLVFCIDQSAYDFHKHFQPNQNRENLIEYMKAYYGAALKSVNRMYEKSLQPYNFTFYIREFIFLEVNNFKTL